MALNITDKLKNLNEIDLDKVLNIKENRKKNNLGLYRMNCMVIGKTGSGKTTFLLKLLLSDAIDEFKLILFIIPRESLESGFYKSLNDNKQKFNKIIYFIVIGEDDLPTIELINDLSKIIKGRIAIVLDDFINAFGKPSSTNWLIFKRYITQLSRIQYGCSLFVLTQNLLQFDTTYRKNFNSFICFVNSLTLRQFKDIMTSYYDYGDFTEQQIKKLFPIFKNSLHSPLILLNNGIPEQSMIYDGEFINPEELFES